MPYYFYAHGCKFVIINMTLRTDSGAFTIWRVCIALGGACAVYEALLELTLNLHPRRRHLINCTLGQVIALRCSPRFIAVVYY